MQWRRIRLPSGWDLYVIKIALSLLQSLTTLFHGWTEAGLEWVRDAYTRSLGGVLRNGLWVLVGAGAFLVIVAFLIVPHIPFNFVPNTDSGVMNIYLRNPPSAPLQVTNDDVGRIEGFLRQQPEVQLVQSVTGSSPNGVSGIFSGTNTANIVVQLTPVQTPDQRLPADAQVSRGHPLPLP